MFWLTDKRAVVEKRAIRIGSRWVLERKLINSIDGLIGIVLDETNDLNSK